MICSVCLSILWTILLLIYVLIVNIIVGKIIEKLKRERKDGIDEKTRREAIGWLGYFEILAYSLSVVLGCPQFIAVWIGVRTLERWRADVKNKDNNEGVPAGSINIFLIGTLLTIIMGVLGGLIFIRLVEIMDVKQISSVSNSISSLCK